MSSRETAFNGDAAVMFAEHADTVRGYVRYELVKQNLGSLVAAEELEIVDIGGGSAIDAIWLAELGHHVTVAEPAADQLAKAEARLAQASPGARRRVRLRRSTSEDLLDAGETGKYDLVVSHGVAMYLPDPTRFIDSLMLLARPRGHVSLLEKNYYGAYNTLVREGKYAEALSLAETHHFTNHMGRKVWTFLPEELENDLRIAGAGENYMRWSGVRINRDTDYRKIADVSESELRTIVEDEYEVGQRLDTRGLGQMLHFIAQKA